MEERIKREGKEAQRRTKYGERDRQIERFARSRFFDQVLAAFYSNYRQRKKKEGRFNGEIPRLCQKRKKKKKGEENRFKNCRKILKQGVIIFSISSIYRDIHRVTRVLRTLTFAISNERNIYVKENFFNTMRVCSRKKCQDYGKIENDSIYAVVINTCY